MDNQDRNQGLPVKGYKPQSDAAIELVNQNKVTEEKLLRQIDYLMQHSRAEHLEEHWLADRRWLAIARTHIEQGFMALNRAIFRPQRVELDEDEKA